MCVALLLLLLNALEIHTGMLNQSNYPSPGVTVVSFTAQEELHN